MKRLFLSFVSIILALSLLVSCTLLNEMNELSEEETREVYLRVLEVSKEEQLFENNCIFVFGSSVFVVKNGEKIYYRCSKEQITEMDRMFEIVKGAFSSLETQKNGDILGWDYGGPIRVCTIENIDGFEVDGVVWNCVSAYFPSGIDGSAHISFYSNDRTVEEEYVMLYLKLTSEEISMYLQEIVS